MPTANKAAIALEAVIFDWAGTLVDFGSLAPTQIFVDAFKSFDIDITLQQARGPMGLSKWQHIRTLLDDADIAGQWQRYTGHAPSDKNVDAIYARFMPMQIAKVGEYSQPINGAAQMLAWLRGRGLKVGSCSGYPREVLNVLLPLAAREGIAPDHVVAGDELPAGGRPGPYMALANVLALKIGDVAGCIKVDDTVPGIEEGIRAGMWSVGVSLSGNEVGYTQRQLAGLEPAEVMALKAQAEQKLRAAGAHYVIDSVADLPEVVAQIEARLKTGERP
ncbi:MULTISPECIES: phosphonoacetaldehyde hydrolase [unclassified Herbaspirillum]|uniref:phosphonoacetaldehyde hydrolase n=1 Tax=unclassified Herbaspirillum TaxID=2624150 RepID=UPI001152DBC4|nr:MULTISPECIES: phosphonoacetaldehyde hydrolase [unclassified Herbaspirillum]MBB5393409.1 phosphonoacetaldehyde hydrolase [Herbaspirillum sp. SJZ102]TQK03843.1 phosphonoacetaldehyde hydrolase [Herbaspirillum sp. SJZ130]TQK08575.1 phosphonoacetaldehyde hydrolase [Herbaspirillum sp. SJZ106]